MNPLLKLYTKPSCPLCDQVEDFLEEEGIAWEAVNILENLELELRYRYEIPVVETTKGRWFYRDRNEVPLREWLRQNV